nr:multiple epidermal growth factor-like domains protein 6 isoform X2 [Crassostrea gigas]
MNIALACIMWSLFTKTLILGYDDLSANRNAAQYKTILSCPKCVANHAVDRNITTCAKTDMGPTSDVPYTWWNVDLGAVHSVHNIRIQFRDFGQMYVERQRGRFAGFSLYVSNTTDRDRGYLCYKNGQELPLLDFNTDCTVHGRYVIYYNERLNGTRYPPKYEPANIITELCEVTVTGCYALHVYGCQKPCPVNCEESRCNAANGTCIGCEPGWIGEYCQTACPGRYYGPKCESECAGVCKDKEPCNHTNGLCDKGCDDGWTGTNCTEACPPKSYGPNCIHMCGHCSGDIPCNETTGKCDRGCKPGYTGELCDTECLTGTFGSYCMFSCNGHCSGDITCNKTTGRCDTGCKPGYTGELCDTAEVQSSVFKNDCNESFYIAGLLILTIATILISIICLLFIRKYRRLAKKLRSLQYTCIKKTLPRQGNTTIDGQHYEELRISENTYHNIELN